MGKLSLVAGVQLLLAACTGSDGDLVLGTVSNSTLQADDPVPTAASNAASDIAQPLYVSGGTWFCSVTSSMLALDDQIMFRRDGSAEFQRYGTVYWNRDLATDRLTVHTPGSLPFVMHGIFVSNHSLQFNVDLPADDTIESDEVYSCVLSSAGE